MDDDNSDSSPDSGYDSESESDMEIESDASDIALDPDHDDWRTFFFSFSLILSVLEYFGPTFEKHH